MKAHVSTLALMLLGAGCSSSGGGAAGAPTAPIAIVSPTPSPTPTPIPSPTPTPTSTATPTPTPSPTPTPASYMPFADIYIFRLGAGVTVQSGCSGFRFQSDPPGILPATTFGQGPTFRFVITPQVWAIGGVGSFDGRDGDPYAGTYPDPFPATVEVAISKVINAAPVRFSITRPQASGVGLDYARLGAIWAPVEGIRNQYQCVTGIPTLAADLAGIGAGDYRGRTLLATAHVRDGTTTRLYRLDRSEASLAADFAAQRVTVSLRLIGTPASGGGGDVELGTFAASAPINPTTGSFVAPLTSSDRTVTGAISGTFFGPQGVEIGAALGGAVAAAPGAPGFSFAGAVFGVK